VRRHAKASSAGSSERQAKGLGRIGRGAFVTSGFSSGAHGIGTPARRSLFLCIPLVLLLTLFAGPADAAPETIAHYGKGAGEVSLPVGVAVERSTGDFYVAEANNFRVSKFDSEGNFLLAFGYGVADGVTPELQVCGPEASPPTTRCLAPNVYPTFLPAESVAVDQATGHVYVSDSFNHRVVKFTSSGQLVFMIGKNVNKTKEVEAGATQAEKDFCLASSGDTCGNAESGSGNNEFSASSLPLAVDAAGVVWVGDGERLASFDASGAPGAEIALPGAGAIQSLAVDSSDNFYVISNSLPGVRKLEAGTGALLKTLDESGFPRTVTLDEADNAFIGDCGEAGSGCSAYRFKVYSSTGAQTYQFGTGEVIGAPRGNALAVAETAGKLYVASSDPSEAKSVVQAFPLPEPGPLVQDQHVTDLLPTTVTLAAKLNPEGKETTYHFEYGTSESYGQSTPSDSLPAGFESEAVEADLEELIPEATYHFRLVATNHCNASEPAEECTVKGPDTTFTTLPAVVIDPQWATDVAANSAELHAEMDPLGVEAEAWLEYGSDETYGQVVPLSNLGDGFGPVERHALLEGLHPGTTYHYRFVARDERDGTAYTAHGEDRAFTTQVSGLGFELLDNRAWEMVSPADKHGAQLSGVSGGLIQAATDGDSLAYLSLGSIEPNPEGSRIFEVSSVLARRSTDGSWRSKDITPPNERAAPFGEGLRGEYKMFSPSLSEAALEPRSGTPLSPQASERTPYLRENAEPGTFTPLVTGKEGYANVPPGTEFDADPTAASVLSVRVAAATTDLRHIGLNSEEAPLVEGAPESGPSLYEWTDGHIAPVSVLPADEGGAIVNASVMGSGVGSVENAISEDGTRVFWSRGTYGAGGNSLTALYMRNTEVGETVQLDRPLPGVSGNGASGPVFQGASADGETVFFTDTQQLTDDASPTGTDLYRCDLPPGAFTGCTSLTDLTAPEEGSDESAEVQGLTFGIGETATNAYFVAKGVLATNANEFASTAVAGEPNLYLWRQGEGVRFIATLSEEDSLVWGNVGGAVGEASGVSAAASPSGRFLAFTSQRSLTGQRNLDAASREPLQQVFRYDAVADRLLCVSCKPTGAAPEGKLGVADPGETHIADPRDMWRNSWVSAILPEPTASALAGPSFYAPRTVTDSGRVFFHAIDALVPSDSNGQWDVYQYEPVGVGSCDSSSSGASISRSAGGCVALMSAGTAEEESVFLDASETGEDVFLLTSAQLSALDDDHEYDVYDARVNGIPARLTPRTECLGEACQAAPQPPNDPTPASAVFHGAGNLVSRCPKGKRAGKRNGHLRCVARKRNHHKGVRSHKKNVRNRGAGG
jgi:hypothetical protein